MAELEDRKAKREFERGRKRLEREAALNEIRQLAAQKPSMNPGEEVQLVPCKDKGMGGNGKYYRGFGIGEHPTDEYSALAEASNAARANLGSKFMGIEETILTDYNSKTGVPSGKTSRESNLENAFRAAGKKALNDYFEVTCQTAIRTKLGAKKYYVAGQISIDKMVNSIANNLEVMNVRFNRDRLMQAMDAKLAQQALEEQQRLEYAQGLEARRQQMIQNTLQQQNGNTQSNGGMTQP